jgi:hypothetical protein
MYRPNFCSECGAKILRLHWHVWTSRRFCDACARHLRREQLTAPLLAAIVLLGVGLIAGRAGRPAPPPLIIERHGPLANDQSEKATDQSEQSGDSSDSEPAPIEEVVYICGARTKKGTPCSRRVHGPVRCWQHKGMRPMLAQDKLAVKD